MQPIWNVYQSFFFLTRSPSDKFSSILDSTLKFLRDPTTEPGLLLIRYNTQTYTHTHTHTHTHTVKNKITIQTNRGHHLFSLRYISCTCSCSDLFCWKNPCSGCNSKTDLVFILEYTFFQLCSNIEKSLRFTRFRGSYVNHPAVVLIKVTLLFCLMLAVQSGQFSSLASVCPQF